MGQNTYITKHFSFVAFVIFGQFVIFFVNDDKALFAEKRLSCNAREYNPKFTLCPKGRFFCRHPPRNMLDYTHPERDRIVIQSLDNHSFFQTADVNFDHFYEF